MNMDEGDAKLLEQMRRTRSGWGQDDFDRLYRSFGFRDITRPRAPHRVYVHPEWTDLRATVGRHRALAKGYATTVLSVSSIPCERDKQRRQGNESQETQREKGP